MVYETGRLAVESGILQGFDMTSECAVTKLMWALGHASDMLQLRSIMYTNYCGEISMPENFDIND
jgi:L-asparaginase